MKHAGIRNRNLRFGVVASCLVGLGVAGPAGASSTSLASEQQVDSVIGAPIAWQSGARGVGVDVALVDTGVTPVQGLSANGKIAYGPDLSTDSQNPNLTKLDGYGHGTAMAGIIAGNDGTADGYSGVAPDARIVSVKVAAASGASDVSQIIAGIDWVTAHAHTDGLNIRVLNLSLGTDSVQSYQFDPLAQAAENAWRHGIVVVVSVGNDGTATHSVADPAIDPYLLAVGAADNVGTVDTADDTVASFSQRGTGIRHADLVAPGTYVYGLLAPKSALAQAYPNAVINGRFLRGSGTSQAAAMTSGAVADLLSARPNLTPDEVKSVLMGSAVRIASPNPNFVGAGELQLPPALTATPASMPHAWAVSTGSGSLEQSRGSNHISLGGQTLTGDKDIFGNAWNGAAMAAAETNGTAWAAGTYNGAQWSGAQWSGAQWSGAQWSGAQWSGAQWSGAQWSGAQWSGAEWLGCQWG